MPDFQVIPHPVFSPTRCATCGTSACADGFVDLLVDTVVRGFDEHGDPVHDPDGAEGTIGHLYMCVQCVWQAAIRAGCADPAQVREFETLLAEAGETIASLGKDLEAEQGNKVVSLADARKLFGQKVPAA